MEEEEVRGSYFICACCGCEFGVDDTPAYREAWLRNGARWFDERKRPKDWTLEEQLQHVIPDWNGVPSEDGPPGKAWKL